MKTNNEIKEIAVQVIRKEKKAVEKLEKYINNDFSEAVKTIFSTKGRVIITGIGKSANIGMKIVSTLNSTGTPAAKSVLIPSSSFLSSICLIAFMVEIR